MTTRFASVLLIFSISLPAHIFAAPPDAHSMDWKTAETLMAQGSWEEARLAYLKLHASLEKTLGAQDPQTVLALAGACDASVPLAARIDSFAICKRAVELEEKIHPNSPEAIKATSDLALLYAADGNLTQASKLLERALKTTGGAPSPEAAGLMNNLGYLYFRKGKYTLSRDMFERAIADIGSGVTPDGSDRVTMLSNLGTAELAAHDVKAAEAHFRQAASLAQASYGQNSPRYLNALNALARAESALGNREEAAMLHRQAQSEPSADSLMSSAAKP